MTIIFLIVYVAVLLGVSFFLGKKEKPNEFAMANRSVGVFGIFSSTFTLIGAGEFLTVAALAFLNEGAAVTLLAGYGIGMVLLGVFSGVARRESGERHYLSLPDFVYDRFGKVAGAITSLLTISAFFALLVLQLFAGAIVVSEISPLSPLVATFLCALVVMIYLLFAGFAGVIFTDKIQFSLMLIGLPVLALVAMPTPSGILKIADLQFSLISTISVLLTGVFVVLGSGDIWQRLYAAKSTKDARTGMVLAGVCFALYGVILASIGIAAHETGITVDPDSAFLAVVLARESGIITSMVVLAVFSAILSTADTEIFLISSNLENERRRWWSKETTKLSDPKAGPVRFFIVAVALIGAMASVFAESLVSIYEILLYALLALSPLVVIGSFRSFSSKHAIVVLVLGTITLLTIAYMPSVSLDHALIVVIPGFIWGLIASHRRKA